MDSSFLVPDTQHPHLPKQLTVAHIVKETFNIKVYHKMQALALGQRIGHSHRVFLAAVRTEPKAAVMEFRFAYGFQHLQEALQYQPVHDGGYTQRTCFAVIFGYFHPTNRLGDIPFQAFAHIVYQVGLFPRFKVFDGLFICPRCLAPAVLFQVAVSKTDVVFGKYQRHNFSKLLATFAF